MALYLPVKQDPGSSDAIHIQPMNFLIIDSDSQESALFSKVLKDCFRRECPEITECANIDSALSRCSQLTPDVVFLSSDFKIADSIESLRRLSLDIPNVPIIAVVAAEGDCTSSTLLSAGAREVLVRGGKSDQELRDWLNQASALIAGSWVFRLALDGLEKVVYVVDESGSIAFSNITARTVFGHLGRDYVNRVLEAKTGDLDEFMLKTIAGDEVWFKVQKREMDRDGSRTFLISFSDNSSSHLADVRLEKMEELLIMKDEFMAHMSHELRTPLHAIISISRKLMTMPEGYSRERLLDLLNLSAESLMRVVDDVLDYSKMQAGKLELKKGHFSPRVLIVDTVGAYEALAMEKGISITYSVDASVPDMCHGDHARLRQIVSNYLSNGCKYTIDGQIHVAITAGDISGEFCNLRISVADTGAGIPEESLELIFQPFYQVDSSSQKTVSGTGLGLAVCSKLADLMCGSVGVKSEFGTGSTFWVEVPVTVTDAATMDEVMEAEVQRSGLYRQLNDILRTLEGRVLLVEDSEVNRELISADLAELGLDVDTASNGLEAVRKIESGSYDLVFMDCHMPGLDGYGATKLVRQKESSSDEHLPIIALSADVMNRNRILSTESGMDDFLSKPYTTEQLRTVCERWLDDGSIKQSSSSISDRIQMQIDRMQSESVSRFSRLLAADDEGSRSMLSRFRAEAIDGIEELCREIKDCKEREGVKLAHKMKGLCGFLGLHPARRLCQGIETAIEEGAWTRADAYLERLRAQMGAYVEEVDEVMSKHTGA